MCNFQESFVLFTCGHLLWRWRRLFRWANRRLRVIVLSVNNALNQWQKIGEVQVQRNNHLTEFCPVKPVAFISVRVWEDVLLDFVAVFL